MKKILGYILLFLIILTPSIGYGENNTKTLIIVLDELSFKNIEDLKLNSYGIGFVNLRARKPFDEISYLSSINVGRKTNLKDLKDEKLDFNYLGDIFKGRLAYLGEADSSLKYLTMDKEFKSVNIAGATSFENIDRALETKDILAIDYSLQTAKSRKDLGEFLNKGTYDFYIIPKTLSKEDKTIITRWLVPVLKSGESGVLTSRSTKRKGLIALEDISKDLKEAYNLRDESKEIGRKLDLVKDKSPLKFIRDFHKEIKSLLIVSYGLHGLMYFAQVVLALSIYFKKYRKEAVGLFIFAMNNIFLSLILSMTSYTMTYVTYLIIILGLNLLITRTLIKKTKNYSIFPTMTYGLIYLGMVFKPDIIYKSYVGFNNLMYGVRFYGFNNAMAGVFLGSSIFLIDRIDHMKLEENLRKVLILGIGILNTIILSSRFAANTGGFITSLLLLFMVVYLYILPKNLDYKSVILLGILGIIVFIGNLYINSIGKTESHAINFIMRIRQDGMKEFFYMVVFKLKELIKFTVIPPFSLVILSQVFLIKKLYRKSRALDLIIITSCLGFLINDTGNVLLIYMLVYGLLILGFDRMDQVSLGD